MSEKIGARDLRQNLSAVLKRVENGERLVVTSRNRPVATLVPWAAEGTLARLIAEGRATPPREQGPLPEPLELDLGEPDALSKALERQREEESH